MQTINTQLNAAAESAEAAVLAATPKKRFNLKTLSIYAGIGLLTVGAVAGAAVLLMRKGDVIADVVEVAGDAVADVGGAVIDTVAEAI